ncbi:MAG TPA: hypothetical protein V6C52_03540 [Coleofasciculaceae cyanobacterium]|jgi:hypothetical protein
MAVPNPQNTSEPTAPVQAVPDVSYQVNRSKLIHVLQMAYSGEKSAALAYQGHAASKVKMDEREMIRKIEQEEWDHRDKVGQMLAEVQAEPSGCREIMQVLIGRFIKIICPWCGWRLPMLGAWLLEENNIEEYARAAGYASAMGLMAMADELRVMSTVEREHAEYFRGVFMASFRRQPAK